MRRSSGCSKCGNEKANCVCPKGAAVGSESTHEKEIVPQAVLENAKIPAMSAAFYQANETCLIVGGIADPFNSKPADEETLFQAASLSKPVSAAIILDLAAQGKWDLDKPLSEMSVPFGSKDMKNDPRYAKLTTRMILSQCSGLPNWFKSSPETFDTEPGSRFTYSGVAYECLKDVVEAKLSTAWGELAQTFFDKDKVGMTHSTFQLPETTHLSNSTIALGHLGDGTALPPPSSDGFKEVPAASLLTTPEDYVRFLRYCYSQPPSNDPNIPSIRDLFSSPKPTRLDSAEHAQYCPEAPEKITWGTGMGVFQDDDREIAFHWGNNPHSKAFCAIDMRTGDTVACFVNSQNGPNVLQAVTESVVGDMKPVFEWLSNYDNFNPVVQSDSAETLRAQVHALVTESLATTLTPKEERDVVEARVIKMRDRIDQLATEKHFSGSLALVQNGAVVVRASYGNSNPGLSLPNKPETHFNIGSIGKMFTAIAIAKLVETGKLDYNRPIRESLSELSDCPDYHATIFLQLDFTPHELLTHTAGLDDRAGKIYEESLGPDMLSFKRVKDYFGRFALKDAISPKTRGMHSYSNLGYDLLGLAIEAITGDYYQYVNDAVFIPAGMTSTVPRRSQGENFALPTANANVSLPNPAPQWLVEMSRDQSDLRLRKDAHFAIIMLADMRKITETRDKFSLEILADYQQISTISIDEYPQFRARLVEKINSLHQMIVETQKRAEALIKLILLVCERLHKQWENNSDIAHDLHLQKVKQLDKFLMETLVSNAHASPQLLNCFLNSLSIAHPAGCWYSTVDDLIQFDQALYSGSLFTYRQTLTENAVPSSGNQYGYGCAIAGPVGDPLHHMGHTGGMPGGLANYQHYPNTGYTLVMVSNEENHDHVFGFAHEIEKVMKQSHIATHLRQSSRKKTTDSVNAVSERDLVSAKAIQSMGFIAQQTNRLAQSEKVVEKPVTDRSSTFGSR